GLIDFGRPGLPKETNTNDDGRDRYA
ncbi:MAG: hypothetical protein JWQ65_792, partial [Devosia sp.]|nr:hypothetical protein [Devosia sp.]